MKDITDHEIFNRIIFIGPDKLAIGGIASVLRSYSYIIEPFHYMPTNSRFGTLAGLLNLAATIMRLPFERLMGRRVLHIHHACAKSLPRKSLIAKWGKLWGYKIILHCHGGAIIDYAKRTGITRIKNMLRDADKNVVLSNKWKDSFKKTFGIEHTAIINNIVEQCAPDTAPKSLKKGETLQLVFIGQISKNKGVFDLLDAMAAVKSSNANVHLTLCGGGDIDKLNHLIKEKALNDSVTYAGWVNPNQRNQILSQCHCLILPSYVEGLPICVLEAMSHGLAVIASNVGGIPDIVSDGENGILINPQKVDEIKDAIITIANNPQVIHEFGAKGLFKVKDFYPENVSKQLCSLYREMLF